MTTAPLETGTFSKLPATVPKLTRIHVPRVAPAYSRLTHSLSSVRADTAKLSPLKIEYVRAAAQLVYDELEPRRHAEASAVS